MIKKYFNKIMDICSLNILWLIFSIPIVTIGASSVAFYSMLFNKIFKNEKIVLFSDFLYYFKKYFKTASKYFAILIIPLIVFFVLFLYIYIKYSVLSLLFVILMFLYAFVFVHVFALIAKEHEMYKDFLKSSVILSFKKFFLTIAIFINSLLGIVFISKLPILIIIWFGFIFSINSILFEYTLKLDLKSRKKKELKKEFKNKIK